MLAKKIYRGVLNKNYHIVPFEVKKVQLKDKRIDFPKFLL